MSLYKLGSNSDKKCELVYKESPTRNAYKVAITPKLTSQSPFTPNRIHYENRMAQSFAQYKPTGFVHESIGVSSAIKGDSRSLFHGRKKSHAPPSKNTLRQLSVGMRQTLEPPSFFMPQKSIETRQSQINLNKLPDIKESTSQNIINQANFKAINPLYYSRHANSTNIQKPQMTPMVTPNRSRMTSDLHSNITYSPNQTKLSIFMADRDYSQYSVKYQSNLPEIDIKMHRNDNKMQILQKKHRKLQRIREMTAWAKNDYGISIKSKRDQHFSEEDFIFQVKSRFIIKKNNDAATKIQSLFRQFVAHQRYVTYRDHTVGDLRKVQSFYRMKMARRRYLQVIGDIKYKAGVIVQKYCRGYNGRKDFFNYKRYDLVNVLEDQVGMMKERHGVDLKIKLLFLWKRYKKRKAKKAAAKKKKAGAAKKKKGFGRTNPSSSMINTSKTVIAPATHAKKMSVTEPVTSKQGTTGPGSEITETMGATSNQQEETEETKEGGWNKLRSKVFGSKSLQEIMVEVNEEDEISDDLEREGEKSKNPEGYHVNEHESSQIINIEVTEAQENK